jgi:subfamily B ATP-binding cassette protein MsbA
MSASNAPTAPPAANHDIRVLLPSFRAYWGFIAITIVLSFCASIFEGFSIGMLIPFLQTFTENSETFATGVRWIDTYVLGIYASDIERLYRICGAILVATWLRVGCTYGASVFATVSRTRIVEDMRMRLVDQLQAVSLGFYGKARKGELLNSIMTEISRTTTSLGILFTLLTRGSMLLIYVGLMFWISWQLSALVLVFFALLSLGLSRLIASVRERGKEVTEASGEFTASISEFLDGIRTVIAYNKQEYERSRLYRVARRLSDSVIDSTKQQSIVKPLSEGILGSILIVFLVLTMQFFVVGGNLDIAFVLTYLFALFRAMPIVHELNNQRSDWAKNRAGLANIAALLRTDDKPYLEDGPHEVEPLRRAIAFENVSFGYEPGTLVLKNISAEIRRGKTTAIVGASGAGKSTLVDLVPRFYDPTEGRVLYDGVDLRDVSKHSLRDQIAVVSQSTHIFNDTVTANIAYGVDEVSPSRVREAAAQANALTFIEEMAEGFDTILGDKGARVSGGQRQRIAIARALLRDPEILILDEATSALDSVSERMVQDSLELLMDGRTVIAIAHRLSTIENADWVVVLEDGEVVEQGTYQDLLDRQGQLWTYHALQYQLA